MDKKQILKYFLIIFTLAVAFFSWFSIDRAINIPAASEWLAPIFWFSLLFVFLCLDSILIKNTNLLKIIYAVSFFASFIFVLRWQHILAILIAVLFAISASERIKNDLKSNIKISLWRALRLGRPFIVFSFAIVISSQYYFEVKKLGVEHAIPDFDVSKISRALVPKILSMANEAFKDSNDENMTVDEFILKIQSQSLEGKSIIEARGNVDRLIEEQGGKNLSPEQKETIKQEILKKIEKEKTNILETQNNLILEQGRKQFSDTAGFEVKGDEKFYDTISRIINERVNNYFKPGLSENNHSSAITALLALILFLTVMPLGSFLSPLWILFVKLIFHILVKSDMIRIVKVPKEVEMIE